MTKRNGVVLLGTLILGLCQVAGCGSSGTAGTVTYEGKPIERGYITFFPAEGPGNTYGADIVNGQFFLAKCPAGKVKILVTTHPKVEVQPTSATSPNAKIVSHESVPANAIGNNQIVEITANMQALTIELRKPPAP